MENKLLAWYDATHRDLPWRHTADPYAIWVSEVMLQQTQAKTVVPYFTRFFERFATVVALSEAPEEDVLKAWEGLGYYSRARNLHRCAQAIVSRHGGRFPAEVDALRALPGIGEYTAGAVASIAFGIRTPAVDGNVERVVSRLCGIREDIGIPSVKRHLRAEAAALVPKGRPGDFNQAMMELGARVCQPAPKCADCPVSAYCDAFAAGDADALPVKRRKAPQKALPRGIALVFRSGRVLLHRREEKLLQGMWCFPGFDRRISASEVGAQLKALGINARFSKNAGDARHVFTHLIWEMRLLRFDAISDACPDGWRWVNRTELEALPLPAAMKAARHYAQESLI